MKFNITLLILAFVVLTLMYCAFSRENSSFLEYVETEYGGDLGAMDKENIDSKKKKTFDGIARVLSEGTEQNVSGYAYNARACGHGDRNRKPNGRCNKYHGSCIPHSRMEQVYCEGDGMVIDMGADCACLMLTTPDAQDSVTKRPPRGWTT